jgi:integrase
MRAWIRQKKEDIDRLGKKKAPWIVFWKTPAKQPKSRTCGPGAEGKQLASGLQATIHAQLVNGIYKGDPTLRLWKAFVREYRRKKIAKMGPSHVQAIGATIKHFERHMSPVSMTQLDTEFIDLFVVRRGKDRGSKQGTKVAAATINKDLRNLKLILQTAEDWGQVEKRPKFSMLREPQKLKRFVTPGHFAAMLKAAESLTVPVKPNVTPCQYWHGFLAFLYVTGWRLNEVLNIRRDDVDFEASQAISRWDDAKGKRDELIHVPPALLELLRPVWGSFDHRPFAWPKSTRMIYYPFTTLQQAAGIHLNCEENHEHTDACHVYDFHDFKRAFATNNAASLSAPELQKLMKHSDITTTQRYINYAELMSRKPDVFVPESLTGKRSGPG